ncbi:hypothetical protein DFH11DRAFT_1596681 [Phellopilus nigrolimitatus]|nr:hypothetical protein DFH11DRAFT_1596681 [Phellopilus nigrolimitatus]
MDSDAPQGPPPPVGMFLWAAGEAYGYSAGRLTTNVDLNERASEPMVAQRDDIWPCSEANGFLRLGPDHVSFSVPIGDALDTGQSVEDVVGEDRGQAALAGVAQPTSDQTLPTNGSVDVHGDGEMGTQCDMDEACTEARGSSDMIMLDGRWPGRAIRTNLPCIIVDAHHDVEDALVGDQGQPETPSTQEQLSDRLSTPTTASGPEDSPSHVRRQERNKTPCGDCQADRKKVRSSYERAECHNDRSSKPLSLQCVSVYTEWPLGPLCVRCRKEGHKVCPNPHRKMGRAGDTADTGHGQSKPRRFIPYKPKVPRTARTSPG